MCDSSFGSCAPPGETASPPNVRWSTKRSSGPSSRKRNRIRRWISSVCPGGVFQSTAVDSGVPCTPDALCGHGTMVAGVAVGANGAAGLSGVAPGANLGPNGAVFEATHGSAPKYKGMNKVNPTAVILSGMLMLRHLRENEAAGRLERAVGEVIAEGKYVTYDLKPNRDDPTAVGTREMADAIIQRLRGK